MAGSSRPRVMQDAKNGHAFTSEGDRRAEN
jgi:hypothetical protein